MAIDGFALQLLPINSITSSSTDRRVGALLAMRLVSEQLPSEPPFDRKVILRYWFAKETASTLKVAALRYLGDCGTTSDLTVIRQEFDGNDNQTAATAADAIIRINLRDSRDKAINALYELQPTSVSQDLLAALYESEATLSSDILLNGVGHQNAKVRYFVVKLLRGRRALPDELADKLISDSDAAVRYEALQSLIEAGRTFSDEEAKNILIKQATSWGLIRSAMSDTTGEDCWKHLQQQRQRSLKDKELEDAAREGSTFDDDAALILAERHFKKYGDSLRQSVEDQYKTWFAQALDTMSVKFAGQTSLIEKTRSLGNFIRKGCTRQGLDVICHKAVRRDLTLVRKTMKSNFVDFSVADIEYLRRFGEWDDIQLIIDSIIRPESSSGSLLISAQDDSRYRIAAHAIYYLGRARLAEILTLQMPSRLLSHLIVETSDKAIRSIGDNLLTNLLRSEVDEVRKAAALKCIRALPKDRIAKLLTNYISGDQYRYYNVVYWLDFGVSLPKERTLPSVENVINKEWRS